MNQHVSSTDVYNAARRLGKKGGSVPTSEAKHRAAVENGKHTTSKNGGRRREIEGRIIGRNLIVKASCPYCGESIEYTGAGSDAQGNRIERFTCPHCEVQSRVVYS